MRWHKVACQRTVPKTLLSLTHQRNVFGISRHLVARRKKDTRIDVERCQKKLPTEFKPVEVSLSHDLFSILVQSDLHKSNRTKCDRKLLNFCHFSFSHFILHIILPSVCISWWQEPEDFGYRIFSIKRPRHLLKT